MIALAFTVRPPAVLAQDATAVDSVHYSVEFENDVVRVLRVTFGPGERSTMHTHPAGMLVFITDGEGTFTYPDGSIQTFRWERGEVEWVPAMTHLPENTGEEAYELLLIEMKEATSKGEQGGNSSSAPLPSTTSKAESDDAKHAPAVHFAG